MVTEQMVTVDTTMTADNTDVLSGTQLDQPGVPGVYTIWAAAIAVDALVTVSLGGRTLVNGGVVLQRANAEIRQNEDNNYQILSRTGGRPVINVDIITATTVRIRVIFLPAIPS